MSIVTSDDMRGVANQNVILRHSYGRRCLALRRHYCREMFWCWHYVGVLVLHGCSVADQNVMLYHSYEWGSLALKPSLRNNVLVLVLHGYRSKRSIVSLPWAGLLSAEVSSLRNNVYGFIFHECSAADQNVILCHSYG